MADLKISQLTAGNPAQTNDEIPIARSGANFKITAGSISALPPTTAGANQVIYVDAAGTSLDGDANFVYTAATGRLGIGTTSPLSLLDVSGTAPVLTLNDSRASATWSAGTALGKLDFYTSDITGIGAHSVASIGVVAGGSNTASPDGVLVFSTGAYNTVATEKMRLDSSGRVGINTTPGTGSGILSLAYNSTTLYSTAGAWPGVADTAFSGTYTINASATTGAFVGNTFVVRNGSSVYQAAGVSAVSVAGAGYSPNLNFWAQDGASTFATRMTIDSSGNLGIGTTSPGFALDVATATARIRVAPSTTTNLALVQATNGGGSGYFGLDSSAGGLSGTQYALTLWHNGNYPIVFGTNNTERARITSTGELLVGTTTNTNSSRLVASGTISETVSSVQYLVASQFDVGTAPNQIPLNQYLGTMAFQDSTAISIGGQVVVGTATPDATIPVNAEISGNGFRYISMSNPNTGNSAVAVVRAIAGTGGETRVLAYGASHSTLANAGGLINYNATGALLLGTNGAERARITATGDFLVGRTSRITTETFSSTGFGIFGGATVQGIIGDAGTGGVSVGAFSNHFVELRTNNTERARIPAAGGFVVGTAALATTATDGFLYIPGCAGTPTGVPTALTGRVPLVVDTTNNKLYFYSSGVWRDAGP